MKYVLYFRVSTKKQNASGLGLEAQKKGIYDYLQACESCKVIDSFTDVDSGSKASRKELMKALELCKKEDAVLLTFKLDRLLRSLDILVSLRAAKVKFTALDCLNDSEMIINIKAAFAEDELRKISERTKNALRAKKAQGFELGNSANLTNEARSKAIEAVKEKANNNNNNRTAKAFVKVLSAQGLKASEILEALKAANFKTSTNKEFTQIIQVQRLLK